MSGRVLSNSELRTREENANNWLATLPDDQVDIRTMKELDYIATIRDMQRQVAEKDKIIEELQRRVLWWQEWHEHAVDIDAEDA